MGHGTAGFAVLLLAFDGFALVVTVLAARDAQLELRAAVFEIDGQGDQRGAALGGFGFQAVEFAFVDQEFAVAERIVTDGGFLVRIDVAAVEDQFAVFDSGEGFGELASAPAEGFDLAAEEGQTAFDLGGDEIFVHGPAIGDPRSEIVGGAVLHWMGLV